jgi:hypothetical protein
MLLAVLAVALSVGGCGGGGGGPRSQSASTTASPSTTSTAPPRFQTVTEQEVAALAEKYVQTIAAGDYNGACATRSTAEQAELARVVGSCARAFRVQFQAKGGPTAFRAYFGEVRVGSVSVHGNRAAVGLVQPGQTRPAIIVVAAHEPVGWRLIEAPDAEAKKLLGR